MPRPDGVLYEYEKAALKREKEAGKPKARLGRPPKPKPEPVKPPVDIRQSDTMAQGLTRIAKELDIKTVPVARNGRPLKASAELVKGICDTIRKGMPIDKSCILHGVRSTALDKWKKANSDILHFFQKAELENESQLVEIIATAAPRDWKAANWLLERRHQWEQRTRTELTGKDGGPITTISHQLFASLSGGGDSRVKQRKPKSDPVNVTATVAA